MSFTSLKESFSFIQLFLIIAALFWAVFPYIRTEILSIIYLSRVEDQVVEFCQDRKQDNLLKYTKMLSKSSREARVLCVYEDNSENIIVNLSKSKEGKWNINFNTKQERPGRFHWPYYR